MKYLEEDVVSIEVNRSKKVTPEFTRFMTFQVERARQYLQSGMRLFPLLDKQSRSCPEIMTNVYEHLLSKIEKNKYDVLNHRTGLSRFQKLLLISGVWLRSRGIRFV